jgi:L-fucose isomerase-like protein
MFILDDILLSPARALLFILKEIHNRVEEELYDEEQIVKQLKNLQVAFELGEISEEEYELAEEKLMERIEIARERESDQVGPGGNEK